MDARVESGYVPANGARLYYEVTGSGHPLVLMDNAWNQKDFQRLAGLELKMWVDGPGQSDDRVVPALRERVRDMS